MFYKNYDALATATQRRVYAVDWLGMGRSSRPTYPRRSFWCWRGVQEVEDNQVAFFVDSLEEWRKAVGVERMHLLGHSWGGYLSTHYAAKHPERVASLILLSPWGVPLPDDGALQTSLKEVTHTHTHTRPYRGLRSWGALCMRDVKKYTHQSVLPSADFLRPSCAKENPGGGGGRTRAK